MQQTPKNIDFFRREYAKQRKLEQYIRNRQLDVPKTKKWQLILLLSAFPLLIFGAAFGALSISVVPSVQWIILCVLLLLEVEVYFRFTLVQAVKCYQHYAKESTRRRCLCVPSCSQYAILCLKKTFPLVIAIFKIRRRLYSICKGEDYHLDFPCKKMNELFERTYLS